MPNVECRMSNIQHSAFVIDKRQKLIFPLNCRILRPQSLVLRPKLALLIVLTGFP